MRRSNEIRNARFAKNEEEATIVSSRRVNGGRKGEEEAEGKEAKLSRQENVSISVQRYRVRHRNR